MRTLPKYLLFFVAILFAACNSSSYPNKDAGFNDILSEKRLILAVIEAETDCFFRRDYDCWQDKFVHTDYANQVWSNADGSFDASVGWDNINQNLGKFIKENPAESETEGTSSHPVIIRKNMNFKFYGDNAAHVTWDQFNSDINETYYLQSKEIRLMEKVGRQWKIVNVSAFWDYNNKISMNTIRFP
jgi:hypothetical protein